MIRLHPFRVNSSKTIHSEVDGLPWGQRVREAAYTRGHHAFRVGQSRASSVWHEPTGLADTVTDREARAAFELGWDTAHASQEKQVAVAR